MKTPRIEDAAEIVVGRFYDVPCVEITHPTHGFTRGDFAPVMGGAHDDRDIGTAFLHYHFDWRFVTGQSLWFARRTYENIYGPDGVTAKVLDVIKTGPHFRRRLKCKRPSFTFPKHPDVNGKLEKLHVGSVVKCNVCPHRGISLVGAPVVKGARVCSGHGLAFNVETGRMQPR